MWCVVNTLPHQEARAKANDARVPDSFIALLKRSNNEGMVSLAPSNPRPGQKVRVVAGPLVDSVGIFLGQHAKDRIAVLLSVLRRDVRTVISAEMVMSAA